jgi:GxxExxY protein
MGADGTLTEQVIGAAIRIHRGVGPGLLESVYERLLALELAHAGFRVERQVPVDVTWRGERFRDAYRADLVISSSLVVEIKAVERVLPVHRAQLRTYLQLGDYPIGLLINFHEALLKDGVYRCDHSRLSQLPPAGK